MLGILWYFACLLGAFIWLVGCDAIYNRLSIFEIGAISLPVGTIFGAWTIYGIACLLSAMEHQTMILANCILLAIVLKKLPNFLKNWKLFLSKGISMNDLKDASFAGLIVAAVTFFFYPLYSSRMIPYDTNPEKPSEMAIMSGGSCWADLPIHMHIAESFLSGRNMDISWSDMHSPIFAGEKMAYPFLPDFHAAVMVKLGGTSLRQGFLIPGFLLCVSFFTLLYYFALRVTKSRLAGLFAVLLTLGAGGMGGIRIFFKELANNSGNIFAALKNTIETDTAQNDSTGDGKIFWFAFMPHVFLPQRGANFAYPMVLAVLLMVWRATDTTKATGSALTISDRKTLLIHAAAFAATLPLVQAHSFLALGIMIPLLFLLDAHKWLADLRLLGGWLSAAAVAVVLGGPQLALFRNQVEHGNNGKFIKYGWIYKDNEFGVSPDMTPEPLGSVIGFFRFWWMSLGPAVPLFFLSLAVLSYDSLIAFFHAVRLRSTGKGNYESYVARTAAARVPTSSATTANAMSSSSSSSSSSLRQRRTAEPGASALYTNDHYDKYGDKPLRSGMSGAGTNADEGSLLDHFVTLILQQLPTPISDVISDPTLLNYDGLDSICSPMNELSLSGRALDALKLGFSAMVVFFIGNYINFQPWDRDNCKLFYIWVFVYSITIGALFAAPIEGLLNLFPGASRMLQLTGADNSLVLRYAFSLSNGGGRKAKDEKVELTPGEAAEVGAVRKWTARSLSVTLSGVVAFLAVLQVSTGFMMVVREYGLYHVMSDQDQLRMGQYIREKLAPKAVIVHNDIHITPSGTHGGRPALLGYTGWTDSHGYNYHERNENRNYILANCLKDSDSNTYNMLRRWGIRYICSEYLPLHHRRAQAEYEDAMKRKRANPEDSTIVVPDFDPDMYLDGKLKRVFSSGRYDLLEVQGYEHPPN